MRRMSLMASAAGIFWHSSARARALVRGPGGSAAAGSSAGVAPVAGGGCEVSPGVGAAGAVFLGRPHGRLAGVAGVGAGGSGMGCGSGGCCSGGVGGCAGG